MTDSCVKMHEAVGNMRETWEMAADDLLAAANVLQTERQIDISQLKVGDVLRHLLKRLSHFIEYAGRYPIPKRADKMKLEVVPRGGRATSTYWCSPTDERLFESVLGTLKRELC